jgi:hypothetical protein
MSNTNTPITLYTLDGHACWAGVHTVADPYAPQPHGVTLAPPELQGTEVARWYGVGWEVLPQHPTVKPLAELQAQARSAIDADADAIVRDTIGDRAEEYRQAEADALAYQAAGFEGTAPASVAAWAQASGMGNPAAAENILAQAAAWRGALLAIRQHRLGTKAAVAAATGEQGIADALELWAGFVQAMRAQLGV